MLLIFTRPTTLEIRVKIRYRRLIRAPSPAPKFRIKRIISSNEDFPIFYGKNISSQSRAKANVVPRRFQTTKDDGYTRICKETDILDGVLLTAAARRGDENP